MEETIKKLNQIKPRQEWVVLLKSEIINSSYVAEPKVNIIERKTSVTEIICATLIFLSIILTFLSVTDEEFIISDLSKETHSCLGLISLSCLIVFSNPFLFISSA